MKTRLSPYHRLATLAALAAVGAFAPAARADWGSLRGNNHAVREPEVAHHEVEHGRPVVEPNRAVVAHPVEHARVEPYHAAAPRTWDYEAERRHGFYWDSFHPGVRLGVLPAGYVQVSAGGVGYDYYGGVYFQPTPVGGYVAVQPPIGAIVPVLPPGAEPITVGGSHYFYAGGAFYLEVAGGFAVVPPPVGAVVNGLPPGAAPVTINGQVFYQSGPAYFLPQILGGITAYVVAHP